MIYLFLFVLIYLAIGYVIAAVTTITKLKLGYPDPMIITKVDFMACVFLWPLFLIMVFVKTIGILLSSIPWPVYKDLE